MTRFRGDDRGYTPVAGTGMLLGIVVLLLAVVGAAMFGFIDGVAPPDGEFSVEEGDDGIVVTYVEGEPIPAEELSVRGDDPDDAVQFGAWPRDGVVEPGDQITIDEASGNENVEVVWNSVAFDRSETLGTYDPADEALDEWDGDGLGTDPMT